LVYQDYKDCINVFPSVYLLSIWKSPIKISEEKLPKGNC